MSVRADGVQAQVEQNIRRLDEVLKRSASNPRPVVLMLCGIAGAGKSTYAKAVIQLHPNFERLSIDGILAEKHGICGVDYPRSEYEKHQAEANATFLAALERILTDGTRDIVLDRSFYAKKDRELYRQLVEHSGGRWVLLHLRAPKDVHWHRIGARRENGLDADCALDISEELLDAYFAGFETPDGEGEITIDTDR